MLGTGYGVQAGREYDGFNDRATFTYAMSVWPRRCYNTGRWIWGTALRGRAVWTGPGEPAIEDRWYNRHEGLIMMLKGLQDGNI